MQLAINAEVLRPFWVQLFRNIGYSRVYKRHVVLEPVCYLTKHKGSIDECAPINTFEQEKHLGKAIASFIDSNWGDHLEQWLVPYISDEKFRYILLADNPMYPPEESLINFLDFLKRERNVAQKLKGLIHYHIDEPNLSERDILAMTWFTKEVKLLEAKDQICIVVSERDPMDTLSIKKTGERRFIQHLSRKLKVGEIDVSGQLFTGDQRFHSLVKVKINF